jgi:hypothetical protein
MPVTEFPSPKFHVHSSRSWSAGIAKIAKVCGFKQAGGIEGKVYQWEAIYRYDGVFLVHTQVGICELQYNGIIPWPGEQVLRVAFIRWRAAIAKVVLPKICCAHINKVAVDELGSIAKTHTIEAEFHNGERKYIELLRGGIHTTGGIGDYESNGIGICFIVIVQRIFAAAAVAIPKIPFPILYDATLTVVLRSSKLKVLFTQGPSPAPLLMLNSARGAPVMPTSCTRVSVQPVSVTTTSCTL